MARHRVICIVDDESTGNAEGDLGRTEMILEAIGSEHPGLVVVFGDQLAADCRAVLVRLIAKNIPTVTVSEGRSGSAPLAVLPTANHMRCTRERSSIDLALPADWAVAEAYGSLTYGRRTWASSQSLMPGSEQTTRSLRAGVDTSIYRPDRRLQARRVLDLSPDQFIVIAIADHPTVLSSRLAVTVDAYEAFDCKAKLLVILDYTGDLPPIGSPIRLAEEDGAEDVHALLFAAADLVISLLDEDTELPLVQAAASGTPAIVGAASSEPAAVREGPFGLRLSTWTAPLLVEALRQLSTDSRLYRRLARAGRAYTAIYHSLEASAWSFATLLDALHGFQRMHLAPELEFAAPAPLIAMRSLQTARARPLLRPRWQAARSPSSLAHATAPTGGVIHLDLAGQSSSMYLRARHGGPQKLRVRAASQNGTIDVAVAVNGDVRATLKFGDHDVGFDSHFVHADFFDGLNRIDFTLSSNIEQTSTCLMLRSLHLEEDLEAIDANIASRQWQPLIGFTEIAPTDSDGMARRWITGPSATLRAWSVIDGPQHLRLTLKNHGEPQELEVAVNGVAIETIDAPTTAILIPIKIVMSVTADHGWNLVSITRRTPPSQAEFRCQLCIRVVEAYFIAVDDAPRLDEDGSGPFVPC